MAVSLQLFGNTQASFPSKKTNISINGPSSLLIYLASTQKAVSRNELAFLFRPDDSAAVALKHLRLLLYRAKRYKWAADLRITEEELALAIKTDTQSFKQAIEEKNWKRVIELYRGDFLANADFQISTTFNTWLELEREQYKKDYKYAIKRQIEILAEQKDYYAITKLANQLLALDNLDEQALALYIRNLALSGQKELALKRYHDFKQLLKDELELIPLDSTQELVEQIELDNIKQEQSNKSKLKLKLPDKNTIFVGRKSELNKLRQILSQPKCRLITIVGLGGVGKSRLVIQLAKSLQNSFSDGIAFIELENINNKEQFLNRLAHSINLKLMPQLASLEQVISYLKNKDILIILDNFEHLLELTPLLNQILMASENLKIIVTSRVSLNLQAEWLFDLTGLSYLANSDNKYEAAEVFINSLKRQKPNFRISNTEMEIILEICKKVAGLPLALELAAIWATKLSLEVILEELNSGLAVLSNEQNPNKRQASIQAVLDSSWQRLADMQKLFLKQFSIFQGGANLKALYKICSANLPLLLDLYNKSFIYKIDRQRFDLHPLIKQYCSSKLSANLKQTTELKYATYYIELLTSLSKENKKRLKIFSQDINNISNSWQILVKNQRLDRLEPAILNAEHLFIATGSYHEANQFWNETLSILEASKGSAQKQIFTAKILNAHAETLILLVNLSKAEKQLNKANIIFKTAKLPKQQADVLTTFAHINWLKGQHDQAQAYLEQALEIVQSQNIKNQETIIIHALAIILREQNKMTEAKEYYQKVVKTHLSLNEYTYAAIGLNNLAALKISQNEIKSALIDIKRGLELIEGKGAKRIQAMLKLSYAQCLYRSQDYAKAITTIKENLELSKEIDDLILVCDSLNLIGNVYLNLKNLEQAQSYFKQGLELAWKLQIIPRIVSSLFLFAKLHYVQNNYQDSLFLISYALKHPLFRQNDKREAAILQKKLSDKNIILNKASLETSEKNTKMLVNKILSKN